MIEIIKGEVDMPEMSKRRFQRGKCVDPKGWEVIDTEKGKVVFKGKFIESSLALHNLNKKYYKENPHP